MYTYKQIMESTPRNTKSRFSKYKVALDNEHKRERMALRRRENFAVKNSKVRDIQKEGIVSLFKRINHSKEYKLAVSEFQKLKKKYKNLTDDALAAKVAKQYAAVNGKELIKVINSLSTNKNLVFENKERDDNDE